jgi:transmembrane sensor
MASNTPEDLLKIARLIAAEKLGELSDSQKNMLSKWLKENDTHRSIYQKLSDSHDISPYFRETTSWDAGKAYVKIKDRLYPEPVRIHRISYFRVFLRYAAVVMLLTGAVFLTTHWLKGKKPLPADEFAEFKPGTQKAILITSRKQQVNLGTEASTRVIPEQDVIITDEGQTLYYTETSSEARADTAAAYNEVITPRGGEYTLILSDRTRVKLNADSRLRFPVSFSEGIREVELEGEAFFEVEHAEKIPFIVHSGSLDIRVYGTKFNISDYPADEILQTTLVEGKVSVQTEDRNLEMKPGQQVRYDKIMKSAELIEVNTDIYTAWIKGLFVFENESLESILTKLSRWYDFKIEFESEDLKWLSFTGDLRRYENIMPILNMISMASDIDFKIEQRTILVFRAHKKKDNNYKK